MHTLTVLIIDDDPDSLEQINEYVKYGGYSSILANSGFEALDIVEKEELEAIIIDAVMPDMNGLEVIRKLRKKCKTKNIPIIMISVLGPDTKLMLEPDSQANYYLSKPYSGKELQIVLDKLTTPDTCRKLVNSNP